MTQASIEVGLLAGRPSQKHFVKHMLNFSPEGHSYSLGKGQRTTLELIALMTVLVMPYLLQQKPHLKERVIEHTKYLERWLHSWVPGDIFRHIG